MHTEITDNDVNDPTTWVFFDGACSLCTASARFFNQTLSRHDFALAPLQTPRVRERLGLREGELPAEMQLLLPNGDTRGGVDALMEIARRISWGWPLYFLANLPGIKPMLRAVYRIIAANRYCTNGICNLKRGFRWFDWLLLLVLPIVVVTLQYAMAPWVFMWALAAGIFMGCKWLTWRRACLGSVRANLWRSLAYFFAWPGMEATEFLLEKKSDARNLQIREWLFALSKTLIGAALIEFAARGAFGGPKLATGWLGMVGIILFLHFGVFDLLAMLWQKVGINAKPVMRGPIFANSLTEFWSARWNTSFNALAHNFVFRPLCRKVGVARATLGVFLISGVVHDLVISLPARAGFGLPTAYFIFQGVAVVVERSALGRRLGLNKGFRGWFFTLVCAGGPAFWLFHPAFVTNVILPMLRAICPN